MNLLISIVTYQTDPRLLEGLFASLRREVDGAGGLLQRWRVVVVENGTAQSALREDGEKPVEALCRRYGFERLSYGENLGYGRGHNAVSGTPDLRLILNPDLLFLPGSLPAALTFLRDHPEVGIVVPWVGDRRGNFAYPCKRYPSLSVLLIRGFAPAWLRAPFRRRLDHYEMRDRDWSEIQRVPSVASGCCFLIREPIWRRLGGFDPSYFLYFEDFDLFLRAREITEIYYLPTFRVIHYGGGAARKGWRHRFWFIRSAWRFFRRHGWRWV